MPTVTKCILVQLFIDMDYETVKLFTNSHQSNSDFNKKMPDTNFFKRNISRITLKVLSRQLHRCRFIVFCSTGKCKLSRCGLHSHTLVVLWPLLTEWLEEALGRHLHIAQGYQTLLVNAYYICKD
jgi:hypothetical protein